MSVYDSSRCQSTDPRSSPGGNGRMRSLLAWYMGLLLLLIGCKGDTGAQYRAGRNGPGKRLDPDQWQTLNHDKGHCAMYGICGDRLDGGALNCPYNIPAKDADAEAARILKTICPDVWVASGGRLCCSGKQATVMQNQMRMAEPFIIGCPACMHNFRNLFCSLFCSPDQASFTNVTVAGMGSPKENRSEAVPVVKEVSFYLSESFKNDTFNSCKDVSFGAANSRAMVYIGDGAHSAQEFLDFIGTVKDETPFHIGSPFQLDFLPGDVDVPQQIQPYMQTLPTCGGSLLQCSCGDCPDAPTCSPPDRGPGQSAHSCIVFEAAGFTMLCSDAGAVLLGISLLCVLLWAYSQGLLETCMECQSIAMASDVSGHGARTPERELSMGASVEEERSTDALLPPFAVPQCHAISDDVWMSLGRGHESPVQARLQQFFRFVGQRVTTWPGWTLLICMACVACCMLGLIGMLIETDPLRLWVPWTSRAAQDKAAFDAELGPFYRIEQIILSTKPAPDGIRPSILTTKNIGLVFDIHDVIEDIEAVTFDGDVVHLKDVCYKPFGDACATQSIAQYWAMSRTSFESGTPSLKFCLGHWSTACRSAFKAPLDPKLVLGGYPENSTDLMADTTALLITLPVNNNPANLCKTVQWEKDLLYAARTKIARLAAQHDLDVSWSTESSVQSELLRESLLDAPTVALSYLAMLTYIALALGRGPWDCSSPWTRRVVQSRVLLGVAGVGVVVLSVLSGLGVCSAAGVSASLIVMEVVPFLALAIGVDNMFLIATEETLQPHNLQVRERVARALVAVGPSIMLSTLCEVLAFLTAALTSVPAVRNFALVAAAAILIDFCLQITAFVAILVLDCERMRDGYADVLPCVRILREESVHESEAFEVEQLSEEDVPTPEALEVHVQTGGHNVDNLGQQPSGVHATLSHSLGSLHEHVLSQSISKMVILSVAIVSSIAAIISISRISIGLDQQVALPQDSYLQEYYSDVLQFARVGPPVYFVVENMNISTDSTDTAAICGSAGCNQASLVNIVSEASRRPSQTYIATPAASWIDDFMAWVQPELPNCCREHAEGVGGFCPSPDQEPCKSHSEKCIDCQACLQPSDLVESRPTLQEFQHLLPWFLNATPSKSCAKGGRGVYNEAFQMDDTGRPSGLSEGIVTSSFRALSQPLSRQEDFIAALAASRKLADEIQRALDAARGKNEKGPFVYVYSVFHPFFEQFLTIVWDSVMLLSLSSFLVLLVTFAFTGSPHLSAILAVTIGSLLLGVMGAMHVSGIQLNAVSLVNIAMCAGIGLEFLSHIAHAFLTASGTREQRVKVALQGKGAAVCSGIVLTKFVGVAMLAFSHTKIFDLYYFRMYMALVVIGTFHGLLLLPVLLALVGPVTRAPLEMVLHGQTTGSSNYEQIFTSRARCIISRKDASASSSSTYEDSMLHQSH
eukprot:jgi/Ulvmu1/4165/UM019_0144.1